MNTKRISNNAIEIIDQYMNFHIAVMVGATGNISAVTSACSIPYFNNRRTATRAGLRAVTGKGSPRDIFDEVEIAAAREHVDVRTMTADALKAFLVDHNIGIDCSGLVYYVLNAESIARGKGHLARHLAFPLCRGLIGKIRSWMRPVENTGVQTFVHEKNSVPIELTKIEPGDIITMTSGSTAGERDHILVVHQVEYQNSIPTTIHYTHAIAWPSDGEYGHGVRQGVIDILNPQKPLTEQRWTEAGKTGGAGVPTTENYTFARAAKSTTSVRRLRWL